jgi:L-cysteine:1D-myo-inositol 2-amino-2-deoxy-alpha-D-glucopyranoside ligase
MVSYEGEKMSKSLGNLVFVSDLLKTYDARAIRLACVEHHYRDSWEYTDELMPAAAERLDRWAAAAATGAGADEVLDRVRAALDDDLDTPGAVTAIDEAVAAGTDPTAAAALLGVNL